MTALIRLNIHKTIAILACLAASILIIPSAFAQDATSSPTKREKVQQKVDTRITAIKEKIASREAVLKEKLEKFKDKKKAQITERANANLNKINQNRTEQMSKHLDRMSALLDKLEARVNQSKPDIKDPAAALEAISATRDTIAEASAAVAAQAEKDYSLNITTESRVKREAQTKRDQLHKDLLEARKMVVDAKQSVANAIRVAKSGKVEVPKEDASSGQQ